MVDEEYCASFPCLNGGNCSSGRSSYSCVCLEGWNGINCENSELLKLRDCRVGLTSYYTMFALTFTSPSGITIQLPPVIDVSPVTTFLRLYQRLVLRCIATGYPQPTIAWYKDGRRIAREVSSLLVIEEVELSDRGVYHCTATNTLGNVNSTSAVINIIGVLCSNFFVQIK